MQILKTDHYNIYVGKIWEPLNSLLKERAYSQIAVIVDHNTKKHCLPSFDKNVPFKYTSFEIPPGEEFKSLDTCQSIWQLLFDENFDRKSVVINLGGGVIGDMGGFCASTYKRGIDFIQIPTTLLSQVDASVGGKLGIDFNYIKNGVGLFNDPQAVFIDPSFLNTLPEIELRSGAAEMIKHSLIADQKQWEKLSALEALNAKNLAPLIAENLMIKKQIVEKDPFEQNIRKLLNFGHTIGHAVESYALKERRELAHGEAVAIGMLCEAWISRYQCEFPKNELQELEQFVRKNYPHFSIAGKIDEIVPLTLKDKKNIGTNINFSLLTEIGNAKIDQTCETNLISAALAFYEKGRG